MANLTGREAQARILNSIKQLEKESRKHGPQNNHGTVPALTEEQVLKNYRITEKYKKWEELFLDSRNKETYGNATESVLQAYGLQRDTQYNVASMMGSENLRKHKTIAKMYLEKRGVTYGKMIEVLHTKMLQSKTPDLWFMVMEMLDYPVPNYKPVSNPTYVMNQTSTQVNVGGDMSLSFIQEKNEGDK